MIPARVRQAYRYLRLAVRALVPRVESGERPAGAGLSDAELLARAEAFNQAAEKHWQSIAAEPSGREHVLNKPFSTVRDTPAILYRVGLVLDALDLGVGHSVLDFGAGSCWFSAVLNRLRCRTVAIDVSPTALALGQEAFRLDPRQRLDLEPRFLPYDGHHIPLPPESVDRVVCFDSFHHVPNQDEVLAEMFRVLRRGGRAVLAEPGLGHNHADHSEFEAAHFEVLENELRLDELFGRARTAGFDGLLVKPYPDPGALTLTGEGYLRFMDGDRSLFPMDALEASLRSFHVLVLAKGEPRVDSRNPHTLAARIELLGPPRVGGRAGQQVDVPVRVTNLGDTHWLAEADPLAGGYVSLGGHLLDEQGRLVKGAFFACPLPRDVAPGETVEIEARPHLPERLGRFRMALDLVVEKTVWFEQCGSQTASVELLVEGWPDSREPHRFAAGIELLDGAPSGPVDPGAPLRLRFRLRNGADTVWLQGPHVERGSVFLGAQVRAADGTLIERDHARVALPRSVAPGEAVELDVVVPAPLRPGRCRLAFDLVAEQVCWFEHHGSPVLSLELDVAGG
jgi:SAM-dependent methyltransferase